MKTLQTILGSLALAGAVTVPASQSDAESLDSLVDNKARVELMQANEKTDAEKIFETYKNKIYRVKAVITYQDPGKKADEYLAMFEFHETLSDKVSYYMKQQGMGGAGWRKFELRERMKKDGIFVESMIGCAANERSWIEIKIDPETKKHSYKQVVENVETNNWTQYTNVTFTFEEIPKKEYDEITAIRKGIIGKFKATARYKIQNGEKVEVELPDLYSMIEEREYRYKTVDQETQKETERKAYVDFKQHNPLMIEINDKGELIFNPESYKNPHKTNCGFNIYDNAIYFHTQLELLKVNPQDATDFIKSMMHNYVSRTKTIVPVVEPNGLSLELHTDVGKNDSYVYVLEKVK